MSKHHPSETTRAARDAVEAIKKVSKNVNDKTIDLDYVLVKELGQLGRFQFINIILLLIPIIVSEFSIEYLFTAAAIPHRCRIPECGESGKNASFNPEWLLNAVPETSTGFSSCQRFVSTLANGSQDNCPADMFNTNVITACESYVYERNNSLVYDFNLGCKDTLRAMAGTFNSLGMLLSLPITGYFSDRYGRRLALVFNSFNIALFGVIRAFSMNYSMYLALQFLQNAFSGSTFSTAFIFATELVGPQYRALMCAILPSTVALGAVILGTIAWAVQSWRNLILILHVPCFLIISYYWLLSESVRWLLSKQKYTEAKIVLEQMAKVNGTKISDKCMEVLLNPSTLTADTTRNSHTVGLIKYVYRSPVLFRRVCTITFLWLATLFIYYGLFINSTGLSDAAYLNFILTCIVDVPGNIAGFIVMNRIGRKITLGSGFFLCAACNFIFIFVPYDIHVLRLIIYLLGKFGIATVLSGLYLYTSELYPTEHRQTLLAFSSTIGRIGSVTAPLTPLLMEYWNGLPSAMFAIMGSLAGLLVFTQPETLRSNLPNTLAEAEAVGK